MALPSTSAQRLAVSVAARRRWIVLAMLLALHLALVSTPGGQFQRSWLLVHFGLFLLWQPFIAAEREIELFSGVLLFVITTVTLYFLAGWMIVAWLLIVLAILGGRVFTAQASRRNRFYLVAFAYVLAILLIRAVPVLLLGVAVPEPLSQFALVGLPLMLLSLAVIPMGPQDDSRQVFDFFYAVLVFQLGGVLVLGSIAFMRITADQYFQSVALTVIGFGIALFVLAALWNPVRGFGGIRTYFSRYLLSVGMPFEMWMRRIAELAESEPDAERFLEQAFAEIAALPWMRGAHWKSPDGDGGRGSADGFATRFVHHDLEVVFHTEISLSPALFLHMRLLAQVVGEFYEGKRRESALRRHAYLQAVHETGARLTHDVKNLLQSLYALTSMAPAGSDDRYGALLQRQLPQLSKRLRGTLDKLRTPEVATRELPVAASQWWKDLQASLDGSDVALEADIAADLEVPAGLFDSFVENALDNARAKRSLEPGIEVSLRFSCANDGVSVGVRDTGSAVAPPVVKHLFREPIERDGSLGIGLYHAARQAQQVGYRVELAENKAGSVSFVLSRE
ncbi:MAG: sensor histidine kinase [Burkholderiales bacterium]|nr:sensor histidine kinase [Burkholderiales bacterium]